MVSSLNPLGVLDFYQDHFYDVSFWRPYIHMVAKRQSLTSPTLVELGIPGTFPTFLVNRSWVVKFFGPLFNGQASFAMEKWVNQVVTHLQEANRHPGPAQGSPQPTPWAIPSPRLLASGELSLPGEYWPWPFLIFSYHPGQSLDEWFDAIEFRSRLDLARDLGKWATWFHRLDSWNREPMPAPAIGKKTYADFLSSQVQGCSSRHAQWGSLPPHLIQQIDGYLASTRDLVGVASPSHLIHADLTRDHILGRLEQGRWRSEAVIDFGDAMQGDLFYELAALHLELLGGDKRLLSAFLVEYRGPGWDGLADKDTFCHKAMATALLHQFNVFEPLPEIIPDWSAIRTLDQLAVRLWSFYDE